MTAQDAAEDAFEDTAEGVGAAAGDAVRAAFTAGRPLRSDPRATERERTVRGGGPFGSTAPRRPRAPACRALRVIALRAGGEVRVLKRLKCGRGASDAPAHYPGHVARHMLAVTRSGEPCVEGVRTGRPSWHAHVVGLIMTIVPPANPSAPGGGTSDVGR